MIEDADLAARFESTFDRSPEGLTFAPGRVNLIGEHIDYHGGPVLPMALDRGISIAWARRTDGQLRARTTGPGADVQFAVGAPEDVDPSSAGAGLGWGGYLRAAATLPGAGSVGVDLLIDSDLPEASGLSSSSALVVAAGLSLLDAANTLGPLDDARRVELAEACAESERFVGTQGGGMDQAASLCGIRGSALRITFDPLRVEPVPFPDELTVIVAHTGVRAEKSAGAQARYNAIRAGGDDPVIAEHVRSERDRVEEVVRRLSKDVSPAEAAEVGALFDASHASLRDRLGVGHPALEALVEAARHGGALGARLTGAGFGGSIVALTRVAEAESVLGALREAQHDLPGSTPAFMARPGAGARVSRWRSP